MGDVNRIPFAAVCSRCYNQGRPAAGWICNACHNTYRNPIPHTEYTGSTEDEWKWVTADPQYDKIKMGRMSHTTERAKAYVPSKLG